jgi:hypothetical protein
MIVAVVPPHLGPYPFSHQLLREGHQYLMRPRVSLLLSGSKTNP